MATVESVLGDAGSYGRYGRYNEILLRRYSENGTPKKPDYIITENGKISEVVLRHAKHFNIPIINIDNQVYDEKMQRRGDAILDSISESDSYTEIDQKLSDLYTMSKYKDPNRQPTYEIKNIGGGRTYPLPSSDSERVASIRELELEKRLGFIKDTLETIFKNSDSGVLHTPPDIAYFYVSSSDVRDGSGTKTWYSNDMREPVLEFIHPKPEDCNTITITFRLKGIPRIVQTVIYDGERRFKPDEMHLSLDEKQNSDSSTYDEFIPLVQKYLELAQNQSRR